MTQGPLGNFFPSNLLYTLNRINMTEDNCYKTTSIQHMDKYTLKEKKYCRKDIGTLRYWIIVYVG